MSTQVAEAEQTPATGTGIGPSAPTDRYVQVQQFYARHFQLLDSGDAAGWADTFTADGWFWPSTLPEPVRGRAALLAGVRATHARLAEVGEQHRHWHALRVRCYAQIFAIPAGGQARLQLHCVCEDLLVRSADGDWQVAERRVTRDDIR
jgi:hypothetical protein